MNETPTEKILKHGSEAEVPSCTRDQDTLHSKGKRNSYVDHIASSRSWHNISDQEGRGGSEEAVPGPSVFPSGNPACRGTFGGRRKAVRDRLALQGGTGDFP